MGKIKHVLFVNPYPRLAKTIMEASNLPPVGLCYTAAYLESKGVKCSIIDARVLKINEWEVVRQIKEKDPDLVGISFNVATLTEAETISKACKTYGKRVIMGGPLPTENLKMLLERSKADCIVRGEGELVTWEIIQAFNSKKPLKEVNGLTILDENGEVINTPEAERIEDLDSLPFPAYHLVPDLGLYRNRSRKHPIAPLVTHRGCPYGCTFCGSQRTGFRPRSPENVIQEMEYMINKFGVKQFDILDDNFTLDQGRAEKILDMIIAKGWDIGIIFPNGLRADRLTEPLVEKMAKGGVYRTGIGIESGNQKIVDGIVKSLRLEQVKQSVKWLRKNNIIVFGYYQFGLPGETKETMQETIDFAKEVNTHWANFGITTPLPGTQLYSQLKSEGLIKESEASLGQGFYAIKEGQYTPKGLTKEEVEAYQQKAWRSFYFRPKKMVDVLKTIRSYRELEWTVSTAAPILKGLVAKSVRNVFGNGVGKNQNL